ncbi:hypothetical protein AB0454_24160 [Streptomyces sp. NPDC093509]|uniref:hypothetical protein n=1 Tax=Streptomyces sp. NPDC093509 TaxID=3154982 RepID=UPI0034509B25
MRAGSYQYQPEGDWSGRGHSSRESTTTTIKKIAEAMEVPYSHLTKVAARR